jgi:hypothetical protein
MLPATSVHNLAWSTHGPIAEGTRGPRACRLAEAAFTAGASRRLASSPDLRFGPVSVNTNWLGCANQTSLCLRRLARTSMAGARFALRSIHGFFFVFVFVVKLIQANALSAGLLAVFALYISAPSANAELIFDKVHIIQNNLLLKYCTCLPSIVTSNSYIPQAGNAYTEVQDLSFYLGQ